MACKISKQSVTKYKVRPEKASEWMEATLESWDGGGVLDIQSDYGNWGYRWCATGYKDFREFLCKIDRWYLFGKLSHADQYLFDEVATTKQLKKEVLEARKNDRSGDADIYREIFDFIDGIPSNVTCERSLYDYIQDKTTYLQYSLSNSKTEINDVLSECGLSDLSCLSILRMDNPLHTKFFEELWTPLKEHWKKELQDEQATGQ